MIKHVQTEVQYVHNLNWNIKLSNSFIGIWLADGVYWENGWYIWGKEEAHTSYSFKIIELVNLIGQSRVECCKKLCYHILSKALHECLYCI